MDQPQKTTPPKPVDTTQVILAALSLVKELGALIALTMMEWARIKQRRAEDLQALAETDLKVLQKTTMIEKSHAEKNPSEIIDNFLNHGGDKGEK